MEYRDWLALLFIIAVVLLLARFGGVLLTSKPSRFTRCSDGWLSKSTGRGTCSSHGGIA